MSLYNMMFGNNPAYAAILASLGNPNIGRFRDAWVEQDGAGGFRIAIYTRNGGGNRECWFDDCDGTCTGCLMAGPIQSHPLYMFDRDDDYDSTYATIYYRLPEEYADDLKAIALAEPHDPSEAWAELIAALQRAGR